MIDEKVEKIKQILENAEHYECCPEIEAMSIRIYTEKDTPSECNCWIADIRKVLDEKGESI